MRLILAITAALAALAALPVAAQTLYSPDAVVRQHSTLPLRPGQQEDYAEFQGNIRYFGAYAINTNEDSWAWEQDYHNLQTAIDAALFACGVWSTDQNADACVIYASVVPKGFEGDQSAPDGVSMGAAELLRGAFEEGRQSGAFQAVAVSGLAEWGYSGHQDSAAFADDEAMAQCDAALAGTMADIGPEARAETRRRGLNQCRIILRSAP